MKCPVLRYTMFLLMLVVIGCSSTQSTIYKPSDGSEGWQVNVIKKAAINDEFVCTINGTTVVSESFPLIGDNFSKTGNYKGKKVLMNGFRTSSTGKDANGNYKTDNSYQIRVFIDDALVDKFDF